MPRDLLEVRGVAQTAIRSSVCVLRVQGPKTGPLNRFEAALESLFPANGGAGAIHANKLGV